MADTAALRRVLTFIQDNPDQHNQREWICGSAACLAGWAVLLDRGVTEIEDGDYNFRRDRWEWEDIATQKVVGLDLSRRDLADEAAGLLGLPEAEREALFSRTAGYGRRANEVALTLGWAIVARDEGDLSEEQRVLLDSWGLPTAPNPSTGSPAP